MHQYTCFAQTDTVSRKNRSISQREIAVYSGISVFYGSLSYGLYKVWYQDYSTGKFHFFNDNNEWLQMDKVGHSFSCYSEAVNGMNLMDYAGLSQKKAMWVGGFIGFGMQTIIEIMDGYSNKWGFSMGDMAGNLVGTSLAISQRYFWNEQRIKLCYSFHQTDLRPLRTDVFGKNYITGVLKDYNGLTAWLSVNVKSFSKNSKFPTWLNVAIGYGAYDMITGDPSDMGIFIDSRGQPRNPADYHRYRICYFSPDISLQRIPFIKKHKTLFIIARFLAPLKVPLPTLVYDNKNGVQFRAFYF